MAVMSAARRRSEDALRSAREELETRVRERTTELERSNNRLQEAVADAVATQHRFRDLVNSVDGIVWEADATTLQFSFVNSQAERILGYPVERWLSGPTFWKDHLHPEDREWAVPVRETAVGEKRDHDFEYRMIAADGRVVWLRDLVTLVLENDRVVRLRGVMVDVTERKRAEDERQARRWGVESMDRETGREHAVPRPYVGSFARCSGTVSNNAAPTDAPSGSRTIQPHFPSRPGSGPSDHLALSGRAHEPTRLTHERQSNHVGSKDLARPPPSPCQLSRSTDA